MSGGRRYTRAMQVWMDGEVRAAEDAVIGVFDRAVLFGESIYEGVRICGGRAPMIERHRRRLAQGLAAIGLDPDLSNRLDDAARALLSGEDAIVEGLLYLQVTGGGVPGVRSHVRDDETGPSRIFAFAIPCDPVPESPTIVAAIRREDRRWRGCGIKSTNLLANVLALNEAGAEAAEEAILVADGRVAEGAYTSVLAVVDGVLHTAPLDDVPPILPSVTREVLLERLNASGRPVRQLAVPADRLDEASEIMIASSRRLIASVVSLDGERVGDGRPGPVAEDCLALLRKAYLSPNEPRAAAGKETSP